MILVPIVGIAWMDMNHATELARRATQVAIDKIKEMEHLRLKMLKENSNAYDRPPLEDAREE